MSLKVLIVDNNDLFLGVVRKLLARFTEVIVIGEASDGEEALIKAKALKPDLILLDIAMPKMTGLQVALELKKWAQAPAILFVTMHEVAVYGGIAQSHGALGVIAKADLVNHLLLWMQSLIDQKKAMEFEGTFVAPEEKS
ncbi:response regulator transcription factor [Undibacterium sp.]|uniref:response regulator n=1 Tax=Undibacterium sp. TaxID=1914977 RepID=UPI003751CCEB